MKKKRPKFVLFGDSITQKSFSPSDAGWGAALTHHYQRQVDVVLRGYSGYNTRWALFLLNHIFPQHSLEDAPALVTIFFGANDAALPNTSSARQHVPLQEYQDNLCKMVSHVKHISEATLIVLITPPPIDLVGRKAHARKIYGDHAEEVPSRTNEITGLYANACITVAKEAGVPFIDLWSIIQQIPDWGCVCLSDGLHLARRGNEVVFEELVKVLEKHRLSLREMEQDFLDEDEIDALDLIKSFK